MITAVAAFCGKLTYKHSEYDSETQETYEVTVLKSGRTWRLLAFDSCTFILATMPAFIQKFTEDYSDTAFGFAMAFGSATILGLSGFCYYTRKMEWDETKTCECNESSRN